MNLINAKVKITVGVVLILIMFIVQHIPLHRGISFSGASRVCNSSLGQLGQAFSSKASSDCGTINLILNLSWVAIIAGLVLVAIGIYQLTKKNVG